MNYLVVLEPNASELEKILSGIKTMLIKEFDPSQLRGQQVRPGDSLYFLRDKDEYSLRVKASVLRTLPVVNAPDDDLPRTLKEMQPRLQLTEEQYHTWVSKAQVLLVEFEYAHKIDVIHVDAQKITDRSGWIAFEDISQITE
jgi:hypothetical protein